MLCILNFFRQKKLACVFSLFFFLSACGGGGSSSSQPPGGSGSGGGARQEPEPEAISIAGAGVKGALDGADVVVYNFDFSGEGGKGERVSDSTTGANGRILELNIPWPLSDFYLIEFVANGDTIDLSTGQSPVIERLFNIVSREDVLNGEAVFATPLSSLAVELALIEMAGGTGLEEALQASSLTVKSIFGLGLNSDVNFLKTPALLGPETDTLGQQLATVELRAANEVFATLLVEMIKAAGSDDIETFLKAVALDMSDGELDGAYQGKQVEVLTEEAMEVFDRDLFNLPLANMTGKTVVNIVEILIDEAILISGGSFDTAPVGNSVLPRFSRTVALSSDVDGDGLRNSEDSDDDNDGYSDVEDALPFDSSEYLDTDSDGLGNNIDMDDDGDGVNDEEDVFPLDSYEQYDFDQDGYGDAADLDDDNDGVPDFHDSFPFNPNETKDFDFDLIGDNADLDDDNDGILDEDDNLEISAAKDVYSPTEQINIRVRGRNNNGDLLIDNDGSEDNDWYVSYDIYRQDGDQFRHLIDYINDRYSSGSFSESLGAWSIQFPGPDYAGVFRVDIVLSCENDDDNCGEDQWEYWEESIYFEVNCPGEECPNIPDEEPGVNITSSYEYSFVSDFLRRENGDLLVTYRSLGDDVEALVSISEDNGEHWSVLSSFSGNGTNTNLIETSSNQLLMFDRCDSGGFGLCIFYSDYGASWATINLFNDSDFHGCDLTDCDSNRFVAESIVEMGPGNYLVSYSYSAGSLITSEWEQTVYVSQTSDFLNWSSPLQVTDTVQNDSQSELVQLDNGTILLAYKSRDKSTLEVLSSIDGKTWEEELTIPGIVGTPDWITDGVNAWLGYALEHVYLVPVTSDNPIGHKITLMEALPFDAQLEYSETGEVLLVYSLDLNNKRDIFFENKGLLSEQ